MIVLTFDPGDGVLSVLGLCVVGFPGGAGLQGVLVHARVSRQQPHVVLLTVRTDGTPVPLGLLNLHIRC